MTAPSSQPRTDADIALDNEPEAIRTTQDEILKAAADAGYAEAACFAIRLALEEAIYNAFRHGHKELPHEPVRVAWRITDQRIDLAIEDKGPGFEPEAVPDPTSEERLELPHGRGLMLMRAYMTSIEYNDKGNRVEMVFDKATQTP